MRYFMLKFSRGKVIVFDIDEALSFEGESGPTCRYAVVRANNIFHKLGSATGWTRPRCWRPRGGRRRRSSPASTDEAHDLWALVFEAARLDEVVEQSVRTLEFSVLAKYAFGLAQAFNGVLPPVSRCSTKSARMRGSGGRRRWRTSARSSRGPST